jgi:DNA replication protein
MNGFSGFPNRAKCTPIPNLFFSTLLPQIEDLAELRVTLHIFWAVYQKRGYPRFVTYYELLADPSLTGALGKQGEAGEVMRQALDEAVDRGTLLHLALERDGTIDDLYFVNTEADRRAVSKIESGEIKLGELVRKEPRPQARANIFELYEQNIGMLSPIVAEELREAEKTYPPVWIEDAFREAVDLNKRNWRYVSRILERWAAEGKDDGEPGRHPQAESDPEEYYRRYGHLLNR